MGPPTTPNTKNKGSQRDATGFNQPVALGEKTSLELLLESTERAPTLPSAAQFGLLRDSLVFNHERILQHNPTSPLISNPEQGPQELPPRPITKPNFPSLNTISSQTNNFMESPTPDIVQDNAEYVTSPPLYSLSDRTAQNRANANLDRHIAWQLQQVQLTPPIIRSRNGVDSNSTHTRTHQLQSGDIPLTNTAASLHLPSPPTSEMFRGSMQPPSNTTVTTVYAYKCDRTSRHVGGENIMSPTDNFSDPIYEERTQEMPYPYGKGGDIHHQQTMVDCATSEDRESEEETQMEPQLEDNNSQHDEEIKLNSNLQAIPVLAVDYATDEDLDDDLMSQTNRQPQPVFPNPADLKWPELSYLRATLDPKYHPFLESDYKKDCRSWLWKNEKGRRTRELLAAGRPVSSSMTCYQRASLTPEDVNNTRKALTDNDDLEDANGMVVGLQQ